MTSSNYNEADMAKSKLEEVKRAAWFKGWDVLLYAVILVFLLALFLAFVILPEKAALTGVEILLKNERVFSCDFEKGTYEALADCVTVEREGETLTVTVTTEDGYNVIAIDLQDRTADMTDADCSWSRDCVHMATITDTASAPISCVPHGLVVMPLGGELTSDGTLH